MRALTYTDMSVLVRQDFLGVVELFPELSRVVKHTANELKRQRQGAAALGGCSCGCSYSCSCGDARAHTA